MFLQIWGAVPELHLLLSITHTVVVSNFLMLDTKEQLLEIVYSIYELLSASSLGVCQKHPTRLLPFRHDFITIEEIQL